MIPKVVEKVNEDLPRGSARTALFQYYDTDLDFATNMPLTYEMINEIYQLISNVDDQLQQDEAQPLPKPEVIAQEAEEARQEKEIEAAEESRHLSHSVASVPPPREQQVPIVTTLCAIQ